MCQDLADGLDVHPAAGVAVVRVVQEGFFAIEHDFEAGAMRGLDIGAKVVKQGFDFAPVDVGRRRILEDAAHQVGMLVTHDDAPNHLDVTILCLSQPEGQAKTVFSSASASKVYPAATRSSAMTPKPFLTWSSK